NEIIRVNFNGEMYIYIPRSLRISYIYHTHNQWHRSAKQCQAHLRNIGVYWEGMYADIQSYINGCEICLEKRNNKRPEQSKIQFYKAEKFNEIVSIDFMGPLPQTVRNHKYILTIIDKFTRFARIIPVRSQNFRAAIKSLLNNWIYDFGIFKTLVSDNGTHFVNKVVKEFTRLLNVKHITTSPY